MMIVCDIVGRTDFFSRPLAAEIGCRVLSMRVKGNYRGAKILRGFFYMFNIFKLIYYCISGGIIIYNIPKFIFFEAAIIFCFNIFRKKYTLILHNHLLHHNGARGNFRRFFISQFSKVVVHCPLAYQEVKSEFPNKVVIFRPLPIFLKANSDVCIPHQSNVSSADLITVAFVGQFRKQKGFDIFCKGILKNTLINDANLHFKIIGENIDVSQDLIDELTKGSNVSVINGYLEQDELFDHVLDVDIIFAPYISSSGSGILSLAAFLNKPVVCSELSVFRHMEANFNFVKCYRMTTGEDVANVLSRLREIKFHDIDWGSIERDLSLSAYAQAFLDFSLYD